MSGSKKGFAAEVLKEAKLTNYFHCVSHGSNLSCSKSLDVPMVRNAHDAMSKTINHFNGTAKHVQLLKKVSAKFGIKSHMVTLCTTRFIERHTYIIRFWDCFPAIIAALQEFGQREASIKSFNLRVCLEKSETLFRLICLKSVSAIMKPFSAALQEKGSDLSRALKLVGDTKTLWCKCDWIVKKCLVLWYLRYKSCQSLLFGKNTGRIGNLIL